jgi:hypothetical protein
MRFNLSKCNVISIPPKNKAVIEHHYALHREVLEQVDNAKYFNLAVTISNKLSSAKRRTSDSVWLGMSLMYVKNNKGPSTVPCGTPDNTLVRPRIGRQVMAIAHMALWARGAKKGIPTFLQTTVLCH